MAEVVEPPRWLLWFPRRVVASVGTAACVGLLLGMFFTPAAIDVVLGLATIATGGVGTWLYNKRRALDILPLELGEVAVRQSVDGDPTLRVRTWLGHGRRMSEVAVRASLHVPAGHEMPLRTELPVTEAVGPLTITVFLPPLAMGEVRLAVKAVQAGRTWEAERTYPLSDLVPGPLDVPVQTGGKRLAWDRAAWDRALSDR